MKTLLCVILVLALLSAAGLSPFRGQEPSELNPAETILARFSDDGVELTSESGQTGIGKTWDEAVANLKNSSVGTAFLQTAEKIVVIGAKTLDLAAMALSDALRPSAEVFAADQAEDAEKINDYLKTRESPVNVGNLKTALAQEEELPALPELTEEDGRVVLHGAN